MQAAVIPFGETTPGGFIWHDLRRTFAYAIESAWSFTNITFMISWAIQRQESRLSMRGPRTQHWKRPKEKLIEPIGQVVEFERKAG